MSKPNAEEYSVERELKNWQIEQARQEMLRSVVALFLQVPSEVGRDHRARVREYTEAVEHHIEELEGQLKRTEEMMDGYVRRSVGAERRIQELELQCVEYCTFIDSKGLMDEYENPEPQSEEQ